MTGNPHLEPQPAGTTAGADVPATGCWHIESAYGFADPVRCQTYSFAGAAEAPVMTAFPHFDGGAPDSPLARSQAAFEAELPELLKLHPRKWVAYADGQFLRLGNTPIELYQLCLKELGLTHDRFVVRGIVPPSSPIVE